jgi:filamentous hemagglutinin family protein
MKRIKAIAKSRCGRRVVVYFLVCCLVFNTSLRRALATPTGARPDLNGGGSFSVTYNTGAYDHTTLVNVLTGRTVINWDSLDTAGGAADVRETLAFMQTGATDAAVLNRISGPATQFNGDLSAPGMRIFMVNPAGIIFGNGATVNVSQLVASGLNMSNSAFNTYLDDPVNNMMVFAGGSGNVTNHADITADSVYFIGRKVYNSGVIQAPNGLVVMAAGDEVHLLENGSSVSVVVSEAGDGTADVSNSGDLSADSGKIVLAAGDTFSRAVSNVGSLAASGGEVTMQAANVENNGPISVSNSNGNGGSVNLTGTEGVSIGTDSPANIEANAETEVEGGTAGDGGSVTIQTDGVFKLDAGSSIAANGGSLSGKGGAVTITCGDFKIAGDISASPGNKDEEPGKLEINAASDIIIANGANAGLENRLYEKDIEALSQDATSVVVNTEGNITIQDIGDDEIAGQFGNIELHATGENSAVTFQDNTTDETPDVSDTIKTTLGDIVIEAGAGGINAGNLTTGKDVSDEKPTPGKILLSTTNGGDITTGDLTITDGWGLAEINVSSSGNLTVNGDVAVGSESAIQNIPNADNAHAKVYLEAGDDLELNGNVSAYAHGIDDEILEGDKTTAEVRIFAGTAYDETGEAYINGDIVADAKSSTEGTAEAIVEVDAWGNITFAEGADVHALADGAEAGPGTESDEETSADGDHAQIIVNARLYPPPPVIGVPDEYTTSKNDAIVIDILANDTQDGEPLVDGWIRSHTEPTAGTLTATTSGDRVVGLTYNPPQDLSTLTFDETGKATVTFTYVAAVGEQQSEETTVTITLTNNLPLAVRDSATVPLDRPLDIHVLANDIDADTADVLTPIQGAVTPKHGTLVLNADGTFTYTPKQGYLGGDRFTYAVTDGANTSAEVQVKISVSAEPAVLASLPYINPAPGLDKLESINVEISGCPALAKWAAKELGVDGGAIDISVADSTASAKDIQPYVAYSKLRNAAIILQDADGSHIAALTQVINEVASSAVPPTEEQTAAIAEAITSNTDQDSYYAVAKEYLDALVTYVGVLSTEMGFSPTKSVQIVTDKYINRVAQDQNAGVTAFITACATALGG